MKEEELLKKMFTEEGFIKHNHYQMVEVEKGKKTIMKVDLEETTKNPYGVAHGGLIFGLGDTAMGVVARSTGRSAVTLNANITYLKPGKGKTLKAVAEMIKDGKTTCYIRCNFYNEQETLIATMDSNYFYID